MLAYLYCTAYTRMTMNESSPPCKQRRITFNEDGRECSWLDLSYPHYICIYRLLPTTSPSPSRHYYPRFIAGINLPTPKGWIAWLAKTDCTHITLPKQLHNWIQRNQQEMNPGCRIQDQLNTSESTAPYIIGRELNLRNCPVGSGSRTLNLPNSCDRWW